MVWNAPPAWREKARQVVAGRATTLLREYLPIHADLAAARLAADLAAGYPLARDSLARVWAEDVVITVEPHQLELAHHHARRLRDQQLLDAEQDSERAEFRYLRNTAFADVASAALWWLRRNDYDVTRLGAVTEDLKKVVEIVTRGANAAPVDALVALFDELAPDLNRNGRYELHRNLARLLHGLGQDEKAALLLSWIEEERSDRLV